MARAHDEDDDDDPKQGREAALALSLSRGALFCRHREQERERASLLLLPLHSALSSRWLLSSLSPVARARDRAALRPFSSIKGKAEQRLTAEQRFLVFRFFFF